MLAKYPKLWGELSYRSGITDGSGKLTPEWRALFERYPDRFLLGSDTWVPRTLGELWRHHGRLPRLARPAAAEDRRANRHTATRRALFAASR